MSCLYNHVNRTCVGYLPDEVLAMTAESWLLEEAWHELVVLDDFDVLLTQSSSPLNESSCRSILFISVVKLVVSM